MKNVVKLDTYYFPWDLEQSITDFVHYYNDERYHEWLENLRPADVYFGRGERIMKWREEVKRRTLLSRKEENLAIPIDTWNGGDDAYDGLRYGVMVGQARGTASSVAPGVDVLEDMDRSGGW